MIKVILLVLIAETCGVGAQLLFKKNTNKLETPSLRQVHSYWNFAGKVLTLPGIWLGLFLMAAGLVVWLMALSRFDLSVVFPLGSIQYITILIASKFILHEKVDGMKLAGTLLVMAGIIAVSFS